MKKRISKKESRLIIKKTMNKVIYWVALLVIIIGNLVISAALVPFLIVLKNIQLYLIIAILGFAFGLLFDLLLKDIEHIDVKHHIIAGIFIPIMAVINLYIITEMANRLIDMLQVVNVKHNPLMISIVYVIAFIIPYSITKSKIKLR